MIEYEIVDEFATTPDKYWDMFFSDAYNAALWKALDIEREVIEFKRTGEGPDETIHRVQRLTPKRDVPSALRKLVKDAISYEERNEWRRGDNRMEVVTIPNFFADKFTTRGTYELVAIGDDKLKRIWKASCECRVALVGGKVEKFVVEEVQRSYRATTIFTRKWIADHLAQ
ncbi:DUF2505 domain-containing protein [Enhygromyxa salina]|uniref:Uncharacterized protein n=1 Tax=Enhygromyxa salina TaxID=215803 RepID=A0A2S9YYM7_9BACT|nr:DUF2505 domain-containing protein [Enhygromyxa salina]PRQ10172.1 hypothetical protein ENSA7_01210 [Enhygromyxa salina]